MAVYFLFLCLTAVFGAPNPKQVQEVELRMPQVQPQEPDTYLCKAMEVKDAHTYLTGFVPHADAMIAHHILLYGCSVPGGDVDEVWNCGEMNSHSTKYRSGSVCAEGSNIIYAWAMDAPKLNLPEDVSFDVGQDTPIKYLVVQVHYKNVDPFLPPSNQQDSSGLTLLSSSVPTSRKAGVYLMVTDGEIPSHSIEYFEVACRMPENPNLEIFPFAFRTHAHTLGRVISGYRIRDTIWTEIGRQDPRLPEMFYNATTPGLNIVKGDILAARCTMENTLERSVSIGSTQNDEMCNFYMMYYVERSKLLEVNTCFSQGPPTWYWKDFEGLNLENLPKTVSVIPGTEKPLLRNATYPNVARETNGRFEDINDLDPSVRDIQPDELLSLVRQLEEEDQPELLNTWRREELAPEYLNEV
ncbi:peptidylglycine alpha-hydroxylating monooxygenase-like [Biomphalaria glabrata]|uniref:peptidylglycine monooxygenase n=1 Tax=Biomphalaria glabrata TaxID=6526 RepID=A0A9W3ANQ5_BIOGL|nr:peptidylglycine alpha-hydroxylating monooxygenase-like [Biomphalaria glabrata]XP_055888864.1 peptidylglycine alpha-hydroxylating monooxygenase-like [Biomphalaria glabrata]KAI8770292.1 putative peptidylglycine alpha-hydroxylating monooxygenase 1 [Biomphalaria glabrata]